MGQSASLASSQIIQNWIHLRVMLPFRWTSTAWRTGLNGISWSWARGNTQACTWEGIPRAPGTVGTKQLESREAPSFPRGQQADQKAVMCLYCKKGQQHSGLNEAALPTGWGVILPIYSEFLRHIWSAGSSAGQASTRYGLGGLSPAWGQWDD